MAEKLKLGRKKDLQLHPSYYSQLPPWPPSPQAHLMLRLSPHPVPHMMGPPDCTAPPKPTESPSRPCSPPGRLPTNSPLSSPVASETLTASANSPLPLHHPALKSAGGFLRPAGLGSETREQGSAGSRAFRGKTASFLFLSLAPKVCISAA